MIKEKIDNFYLSQTRDRERTKFWISEAGKCARQIYFYFKKYPKKEKDARVLRIMDHGDYTHMRIMSVLFALGLVKAAEIDIPSQEIVTGRADAIVNIEGKPNVVEIKSISSYGFQYLEKPRREHLCQIQLYMHYFKIEQGILIYENKDNQDLKEFIVNYDEKIAKSLLEEFEILKHMIENNIIPQIPLGLEDWECRYCDYAEECKKVK
jgi:CRISPR/Cas system-associated exonuclease Cas4 (RecB family)